ncbi:tyrosine-type recombinase/integrase [Streptomyces chartreusis]|uniref:tyrosine-type recombinase/integrase n=1 Tax=Streptomyces chartreusis TaxID=1969 RepID=UPI002E822E28|nr:tyrosine-type recombinase/integrase [Streptomyces chartreusis]WUB18323.1 site-specific integrase [Streptomyces chartreusis]
MAQVVDRWHLSRPAEGAKACTQHTSRTKALVPSVDHGKGLRWQVRYRDPDGKQVKENFATKPPAERRAAEIAMEMDKGTYVHPSELRITFREYAEQWRKAQPHRPTTARDVETVLRLYVYPKFGDRQLTSIRKGELQAWLTGLVRVKGLAPRTAIKVKQKVTAVFNAAVHDRLIPASPCAGLKAVEVPHAEVTPLTSAEVHKLAGAMPDRYRVLVILAAGSGLRAGELFGLQVKHIDFLRRTVKVEQQVQRAHPGVVVWPPKTKHSYRTVPVPQRVIDALAAHLKAYPAEQDGFLFAGPVNADHFADTVWRPAVKAAGLPKGTRLHALRHTYASVLIKHGKGPKTVAARLGDTVAVAMAIYAHLFPDEDEGTREAVEEFLQEAA